MIDKYEKKRYYIDPSTLPSLKPSSSQPSSHPHSPSASHPKSIPLRTTQITLTTGSSTPSSNTSSTLSNSFSTDFQLAPKDPFSSSSGTNSQVARSSRSQLQQQQQQQQLQSNFADFDSAVFSSVQPGIAAIPEPSRKPMTAPLEIPKEDKYAALKDLDSIMKQQHLSTTPTTPNNQNINGDMPSSNGWNGGVVFGSPSPSAPNQMFPTTSTSVFGASPKMNGFSSPANGLNNATTNGFSSPANGFGSPFANTNGSVFSASSNSSMFGSPSTNGSLFGSPGTRSSDSPITNAALTVDVANPSNPFRSDGGWPSQPVSNGTTLVNGGFPSSQSLDFSASKFQWPTVNNHIANPFKMNTATPQTTAPHHSSNPFL